MALLVKRPLLEIRQNSVSFVSKSAQTVLFFFRAFKLVTDCIATWQMTVFIGRSKQCTYVLAPHRRENPQYWQCIPAPPTYPEASAGTTLLPAFGQCGALLDSSESSIIVSQCVKQVCRMYQLCHTQVAQSTILLSGYAAGNYDFNLMIIALAGGNPPANSTVTVNSLGQFENVQCPEGYTCQYQDATYSLCKIPASRPSHNCL